MIASFYNKIPKIKKAAGTAIIYVLVVLGAFISIFPFLWMIISSTNTNADILQKKLTIGTAFFSNYRNLINLANIWRCFFNSLIVTLMTGTGMIVVCSLAGYGFAKFKSRGKSRVFSVLVFAMMIPFSTTMIPLFIMMVNFKLINNFAALFLTALPSVFLLFFFRQSFESFPLEIIEAARIDGTSEFYIFAGVVAPSMKTTFAAGAIWSFMRIWNDFLWPLLVIQTPDKQTLTLMLSAMNSAYYIDYGALMLAIVIATIPLSVIFFTLQRYFVSGIVGIGK